MRHPKLVRVEWNDITSHSGWDDKVNTRLINCSSIGYMIHKDKSKICVCQSITDACDSHYGEQLVIPMKVIKKIYKLQDVEGD